MCQANCFLASHRPIPTQHYRQSCRVLQFNQRREIIHNKFVPTVLQASLNVLPRNDICNFPVKPHVRRRRRLVGWSVGRLVGWFGGRFDIISLKGREVTLPSLLSEHLFFLFMILSSSCKLSNTQSLSRLWCCLLS